MDLVQHGIVFPYCTCRSPCPPVVPCSHENNLSVSLWGIHDLSFVLILFSCLRPLQDHLHGLVVVSLDLEVRYPAVPLGGRNLAMPQEVLDGSKVSIGVEKLRGHGVAKPMTRDVQPALSRIAFDPLLDASDR